MAIKLSPPWVQKYHQLQAMFKLDSDINVILEDTDIKLYVEDPDKAAALEETLVTEYNFGNVVTHINIIPANKPSKYSIAFTGIGRALYGNKAVADYVETDTVLGHYTYIIFKKEVVQYYTDDLGDAYGVRSTLYQDIAKEIFEPTACVFFCTNVNDNLKAPLGEWP